MTVTIERESYNLISISSPNKEFIKYVTEWEDYYNCIITKKYAKITFYPDALYDVMERLTDYCNNTLKCEVLFEVA